MNGEPNEAGFSARDGLLLAAAVALAVALRCIHLSDQSVWYDEYITIRFADAHSLIECLREQLKWDWHMVPVYHILEYFMAHLFGGSILAVRGLSVLFAAGAAALIYLIGRHLFGTWAGAVAAALFAMSPFHIFHGQEIRPYSLVVMLAMLSVYSFVRAVSGDGRRWWALHVAANVLLMWTHLLAAIILAPMGLFLLLFRFRSWRRNALWGAVHVAFLVLVVLWIHSLQGGMDSPKATPPPMQALWQDLFHRDAVYLHWMFGSMPLSTTPAEIGSLVHKILIVQPRYENALTWTFVAACLFLATASVGFKFQRQSEIQNPKSFQWTVLLFLLFAIPSLLLFALTWATRLELFQVRFSVYSSPALYLIAGGAVSMLQIRRRRVSNTDLGSQISDLGSQISDLKSQISDLKSKPSAFSLFLRVPAAAAIVGLMGVQTILGVELPVRHGYLAAAKVLRAEKRPDEPLVAHSLYTQWLLAYNLGKPPIPTIETRGYDGLCNTTDELVGSGKAFWVVMTAVPPHCPSPPDMTGLAEHYADYLTQHGAHFASRRFLGQQNVHVFHVETVKK